MLSSLLIIRGLYNIGKYLGVSDATVLKWHYMLPERPELCLPMCLTPNRSNSSTWITDTTLLCKWIQRLSELDIKENHVLTRIPRKLMALRHKDRPGRTINRAPWLKAHERHSV